MCTCGILCPQTVEAFEILILSVLSASLKCEWGLSSVEEASLTSVSGTHCTRMMRMKIDIHLLKSANEAVVLSSAAASL